MCITDFIYEAAEKERFLTQEEFISLTTLRKLKTDAGHMMPRYNSAEHEDSERYRLKPGNFGKPTSIKHETKEGKNDETHSAECISINDVSRGGNSGSGIGDNSEPRIPMDKNIAIRAQAGIAAAFPTTYDSLMMCLSRNTSRPPIQRR